MSTSALHILLLAVVTTLLPLTQAQDVVFRSPLLYDLGFYGFYPRTWYKSFKQSSPLLNFQAWDERCDDGYYLFSPRGTIVSNSGPVIVDGKGNLVWTSDRFGETTDVKIQTYKGKEYITFWAGVDGVRYRYGCGTYYMVNSTRRHENPSLQERKKRTDSFDVPIYSWTRNTRSSRPSNPLART